MVSRSYPHDKKNWLCSGDENRSNRLSQLRTNYVQSLTSLRPYYEALSKTSGTSVGVNRQKKQFVDNGWAASYTQKRSLLGIWPRPFFDCHGEPLISEHHN